MTGGQQLSAAVQAGALQAQVECLPVTNGSPLMPVQCGCPHLQLLPGFFSADDNERLFQRLRWEQRWPDNRYQMAGRQFELPRLQTWHADPGIVYRYSNNLLASRPWTPLLLAIRRRLELQLGVRFNAVLVNYYRTGEDHVGWHSDDEPELGPQPFIASLSLGAERRFAYRHRSLPVQGSLSLPGGSLLTMAPDFQHEWLHSVPSQPGLAAGRINLTWRVVLPPPDA